MNQKLAWDLSHALPFFFFFHDLGEIVVYSDLYMYIHVYIYMEGEREKFCLRV